MGKNTLGNPCFIQRNSVMLSHRKFGFQFTSFQKGANLTKLAKEAIKNIDNAIPFAEQLFQEEIKQKVIDGRISLSNEYRPIKERYDFFRRKAAAIYKKMNFPTPTGDALRDYEMLIMQNLLTPPEASFYTVAMLDAFFSLLEHSLVLIIPFLNHGFPENNNLEQFIGMNWKGKYQYVFSKSDPKTVAHQLNALIDIKEEYRNPISHGHFHKNGNSFNVHMENLGAIPMSLSKNRGNLSYGFKLPGDKEFKQICNVLDCFDDFIAKNKETKYGIQYIKTGFIVAFDKSSHEKYMDAMSSEKAFGNFLDYTSYQIESSANMDW
ncbi:hypothetical protein ACTJKC_03950 [Pedobacter sp. 22226]|uniref:hypothetical protein n=1 Tax=Pedobacter sp. 22226 TaxID=3453894 RepID=UPI003F828DC9